MCIYLALHYSLMEFIYLIYKHGKNALSCETYFPIVLIFFIAFVQWQNRYICKHQIT